MRKRHKLLVAAAALVVAVFTGCSMINSDFVSSSSNSDGSRTAVRTLEGIIDNMGDYDSSISRAVMPTVDDTVYDYWLYGKTVVGTGEIAPEKITPAADTAYNVGKFSREVTASAWDFTLVAIDRTKDATPTTLPEMMTNASLVAYAYADLSKASAGSTFHLVPDGLTGQGTVAPKIMLSNDNGNSQWEVPTNPATTVFIYIENIITGAKIAGNDENSGTAITINSSSKTYDFPSTQMDPGTYNLVVCFKTAASGTTPAILSYWSDVLVVLPQRLTGGTVYVPNIIGEKPAKPADLKATYIKDSEDMPGHEEFYKAKFAWDGSAVVNERYFEFELMEVKNESAKANYDGAVAAGEWKTSNPGYAARRIYDDPNDYISCDERFSGSLVRNNSDIVMWLPMGKAYWARLRSVNNYGKSDWLYLTLDATGAATDEKYFSIDATVAAESVNLSKITYIKNGGKSEDDTDINNKIVYFVVDKISQSARNVVPFWAANADDVKLKRGNDSFVGWTTNGNTATQIYKAVTATATATAGKAASIGKSPADANFKQTTAAKITAMKDAVAASPGTPTTAAGLEGNDDGGYLGWGPLTLYADYTGSLIGNVTLVDMAYEYRLATDWILYGKTSADTPVGDGQDQTPPAVYESGYFTWSKSATTQGKAIKFAVKLPNKGEYRVGAADPAGSDSNKYTLNLDPADTTATSTIGKTVSCTATVKDTNGKIKNVSTALVTAFGTKTDLTPDLDITNWENGAYTVYIDAVVKTSGQTITRSVSITMNITD